MKIPYDWNRFVEWIENRKDFINRNPSIDGGNIVFELQDNGKGLKGLTWSYDPPQEISIGITKYRKVEE